MQAAAGAAQLGHGGETFCRVLFDLNTQSPASLMHFSGMHLIRVYGRERLVPGSGQSAT